MMMLCIKSYMWDTLMEAKKLYEKSIEFKPVCTKTSLMLKKNADLHFTMSTEYYTLLMEKTEESIKTRATTGNTCWLDDVWNAEMSKFKTLHSEVQHLLKG